MDHVNGLELFNRWSQGEENPFATADWGAAGGVASCRIASGLRQGPPSTGGAHLVTNIQPPREMNHLELTGVVASVAHLAYHLGAIRQINRSIEAPPRATD